MQSEQLYDYVAVLEDEMADVMDADAECGDQSSEAQEDRATAFLVERVKEFDLLGTPLPWAKIAAYALAVAGNQIIGVSDASQDDDEIPF